MAVSEVQIIDAMTRSCWWYCTKLFYLLFMKYLLAIAAVTFISLLAASVRVRVDFALLHHYFGEELQPIYWGSLVFVLVVGHGYFSTSMNSIYGMLFTGAFLCAMLPLTLVYFAAFAILNPEEKILQQLTHEMDDYQNNAYFLYYLHTNLMCCGIVGKEDWLNRTGFIPGICCGSTTLCPENRYTYPGCMSKASTKIGYIIEAFEYGLATASFAEAICILLTMSVLYKIIQIIRKLKSSHAIV